MDLERSRGKRAGGSDGSLDGEHRFYRSYFKNLPGQAYIWLRRDGTFVLADFNDAAIRPGGSRPADYLGVGVEEMYPDRPDIVADMERAFSEEGAVQREMDYRFRTLQTTIPIRVTYVFTPPDAVVVYTEDLTDRRRDEQERDHLRAAVVTIAEREHAHLARILHDGLGQQLKGLALLADTLTQSTEPHVMVDTVGRITELIAESLVQVKDLSRGLHPVAEDGSDFVRALEHTCEEFRVRHGVELSLRASAPTDDWAGLGVHIYRVAREAVHNAIFHGRARRIGIDLTHRSGTTRLVVRDDGEGLTGDLHRPDAMGVRMMRYRTELGGGRLDIEEGAAGGVIVTATFGPTVDSTVGAPAQTRT